MIMQKIKTKKTAEIKSASSKKESAVQTITSVQNLTRGDVAQGGSSLKKNKPVT